MWPDIFEATLEDGLVSCDTLTPVIYKSMAQRGGGEGWREEGREGGRERWWEGERKRGRKREEEQKRHRKEVLKKGMN